MESAGVRYLRTRCFCIRNLTRSLRSLILIRQQLVRKYRTPALSMKYSLYIIRRIHTVKTMAFSRLTFVSSVLRTSATSLLFSHQSARSRKYKSLSRKVKRMVNSTWSTLQWWCSDIFSNYSSRACWIWDDYSQLISNAHSWNNC